MMRAGTLAIIFALSAILLAYSHAEKEEKSKPVSMEKGSLYLAEETEGLILDVMLDSGENIQIKSWEEEEIHWLFLPALLQGQQVFWEGKEMALQEGGHLLRTEEGQNLQVQILFGSEIPFAFLNTDSGNLQYILENKENKETGSLCFVGEQRRMEYAGSLSKVKVRGNSTRLQPKTPYRIGLSEAASLGGLDASKDYVLLAEYGDISLMQNWAAMELASRTTEQYEPEGRHIDLYVNGEYMGVYLLCEGISLGENRLELTDMEQEMETLNSRSLDMYEPFAEVDGEDTMAKGYEIPNNPKDITGGYLLELEYSGRYEGEEEVGFRTDRDWTLVIKKPGHASREQVEYIRDAFQQAENAMYGTDWQDPDTGLMMSDVVDMESFVHKYLIDEICLNTDLWTSQFLYKNRGDEKFRFGPMWDYDMAFGHYDQGFSSTEFYANWHIWYGVVYDNPEFQEILRRDYREKYLPVLEELTDTLLEEKKTLLEDSARMNFTRWKIGDIYSRNSITNTGNSFEECVESLEKFIKERTEFLSLQWLEDP